MNELIVECLESLQQELDEQGIAATTNLEADPPLIMGHRGQVREVVLNLVQNAIEAMGGWANSHRNLRLDTKWQGQSEVTILVQDTGPGIEQQSTTRIFDAFVTTKAKGTGLGLAVSRMIVEHHGGRISVWSDPGSGARFQITLPIKGGLILAAAHGFKSRFLLKRPAETQSGEMSALGQKRTFWPFIAMSAMPPKGDTSDNWMPAKRQHRALLSHSISTTRLLST